MVDEHRLHIKCHRCGGTGEIFTSSTDPPSVIPCPTCDATGSYFWGTESPTTKIVYTYEILEATDITEYGNLSDSNKNAYDMILKCGIANLTDGTQIRTNLWAMFDCDSDTRANLITLLGE